MVPDKIGVIRDRLLDGHDLVGPGPAGESLGAEPEPVAIDLLDAVGFEGALAIDDLFFDLEHEVTVFLHDALADPVAAVGLPGERARCRRPRSTAAEPVPGSWPDG